jgi:glucose-1-phosphate cytidylyltransferase
VVVLCGGRGTRLQERGPSLPKPLVEIGGHPILWHVISIYVAHGFGRFLLLVGHRGAEIETFVADCQWPAGVVVRCLATGEDTPTGGRLFRAAEALPDGRFCVTYADGVADVDLGAVLGYHAEHGGLATMTVVRPRLPFGVAAVEPDGLVRAFSEKPVSEHWVNGGFFVFEPPVLGLVGPGSVLEGEPLSRLAAAGQLRAFRHRGFWRGMDTSKDATELRELWASGSAPWWAGDRGDRGPPGAPK